MEYELSGFIKNDVHYLPIRIYYADTDFSGFVYHGRYTEFMERGRTEALRCFGLVKQINEDHCRGNDPLLFAVTNLNIHFKAPAHIDDILTVETRVEKLTGVRIFIRQKIWKDDILLTDAECCLVIINKKGRPQRIPDAWRSLFPDGK